MVDWITFDTIVAIIILFFAIFHMLKGGIYSLLSIGSLVVSVLVAWALRDTLTSFYSQWIVYKPLSILLSLLSIFIPLYIILKFISSRINKIISASPLNLINRILGLVYGILKGFIIIVVFISIAKSYGKFDHQFFAKTITGPPIEWGADYIIKVLNKNKDTTDRVINNTSNFIKDTAKKVSPDDIKNSINSVEDTVRNGIKN